MTAKRIALVTCNKYRLLTEADRVLADTLAQAGAQPVAADWRDPDVRWESFDLAVLRSTWDYHLHPHDFSRWVDSTAARTRLLNSAPLVRWNMNKHYLADLAAHGVALLPFIAIDPGAESPLRQLAQSGWREVVVKPLIGASAWQISRIPATELEGALTTELRRTGYLVQPYAPEIEGGEYSIVFFNGAFSHAVLKKPRTGDFRTQPELGGTQSVVTPSPSLLADAAAVLEALPERPAYARIDGIAREGRFLLMEAELIEPELYFHLVARAADTFARLLLSAANK